VYTDASPEAAKTLDFVRNWIRQTELYGALTYELKTKIPAKVNALASAKRYTNVARFDTDWQPFAVEMIQRHLKAVKADSFKSTDDFDRKFLEQFADSYAFDDRVWNHFGEEPSTDSAAEDLPVLSQAWQDHIEAKRTVDYSEEFKQQEKKRHEEKREEKKSERAIGGKETARGEETARG
jgi:hypothetical protein